MSSSKEEKAEQVYEIIKNKIAVSKDVPSDILTSFNKLTLLRKKWLEEASKLPDTDTLKQVLAKSYWIEFEFGVDIDYGKKFTIPSKLLPELRTSVFDSMRAEGLKGFLYSQFDIFDKEMFPNDALPAPDRSIPSTWTKSSLTVRHYYSKPPKISKEMIRDWWSIWDGIYKEQSTAGAFHVLENTGNTRWIEATSGEMETLDLDGDEENSYYPAHLCISRIRLFNDKCFSLGHSVFTGNLHDRKCMPIER